MRRIRADIIGQLSGVDSIAELPLGVPAQIRDEAVALLKDPKAYAFQGRGCGGDEPGRTPSYAQETRIGRFEP
jgi:hypothetical protein